MSLNGCKNLLSQLQSMIWSRSERKNAPSASLFDVDLTHSLLLANDLDLIAYFVCESNAGRHSFDEDKWRRRVRCIHLHILNANHSGKKRLACFDIFHPIQFECLGDFAKNPGRDFKALSRQLKNFALYLEITGYREKNRHDEPAKETAQKIYTEIFPLRRCAAPDDLFRHP